MKSALERIKEIEEYKHESCHECEKEDMDFLIAAFNVMHGLAHEMSDFASGGNGDYGTIENEFNERMSKEKSI